MVSTQPQIKFFDYRHFIERFNLKGCSIDNLLDTTYIEALNKDFLPALHRALMEWASSLDCVDVVFWNATSCYLSNLFYPLDKSQNTVSLLGFQEISLKNIPYAVSSYFHVENFIHDLSTVKNVIDLNFPAFVMKVEDSATLIIMVKSASIHNHLVSTADLFKEAEGYLCKQVQRLNQKVQIQETKFSSYGEVFFPLKEHFLAFEEWKKIDPKIVDMLINDARRCFRDLYQSTIFKNWNFDFSFFEKEIHDFKIYFYSENIRFISLLLQFFSYLFSAKLNCLANQVGKITVAKTRICSNLNLKIQFSDKFLSLLDFSDTFATRFRMLAFYSSVKSAISHDGASILALGGFYLSPWYLDSDLKKFWKFSDFLEKLVDTIKIQKNPNFVFSVEDKSLSSDCYIEVSSGGIFIRKGCLLVDLNIYMSIFFNAIAERLSLLVDALNDELEQKNKNLTFTLLGYLINNQQVNSSQIDVYSDLKKISALGMSDLLSGSSSFRCLFSKFQKEHLQNFVMQKYSDFYREILLCKIQEITSCLQTLEGKKSLSLELEQLLENIRSFYIETKDLHPEAMLFAFGKLGRDLLIRTQQIMIDKK